MRKIVKRIFIVTVLIILTMGIKYNYGTNENIADEVQTYIENENIDISNVTEQDILDAYEDFTENYSTDAMIELLEKNKEKLNEQGISDSTIEAGKKILKTTDEDELKAIIKENVDIKDIQEKIEKGYTPNQIVKSIIKEMPTEQKINTAGRLILSNQIVKIAIAVFVILFIYCTILRAIIYHKAGKKWFAALIPIYRQVTMYNICDLSLGYMFLWLVPIIGWIILFFIAIMKRIYLSQNFGKGIGFGVGLIVLPPIFQSILAFNKNIQYIQEDER